MDIAQKFLQISRSSNSPEYLDLEDKSCFVKHSSISCGSGVKNVKSEPSGLENLLLELGDQFDYSDDEEHDFVSEMQNTDMSTPLRKCHSKTISLPQPLSPSVYGIKNDISEDDLDFLTNFIKNCSQYGITGSTSHEKQKVEINCSSEVAEVLQSSHKKSSEISIADDVKNESAVISSFVKSQLPGENVNNFIVFDPHKHCNLTGNVVERYLGELETYARLDKTSEEVITDPSYCLDIHANESSLEKLLNLNTSNESVLNMDVVSENILEVSMQNLSISVNEKRDKQQMTFGKIDSYENNSDCRRICCLTEKSLPVLNPSTDCHKTCDILHPVKSTNVRSADFKVSGIRLEENDKSKISFRTADYREEEAFIQNLSHETIPIEKTKDVSYCYPIKSGKSATSTDSTAVQNVMRVSEPFRLKSICPEGTNYSESVIIDESKKADALNEIHSSVSMKVSELCKPFKTQRKSRIGSKMKSVLKNVSTKLIKKKKVKTLQYLNSSSKPLTVESADLVSSLNDHQSVSNADLISNSVDDRESKLLRSAVVKLVRIDDLLTFSMSDKKSVAKISHDAQEEKNLSSPDVLKKPRISSSCLELIKKHISSLPSITNKNRALSFETLEKRSITSAQDDDLIGSPSFGVPGAYSAAIKSPVKPMLSAGKFVSFPEHYQSTQKSEIDGSVSKCVLSIDKFISKPKCESQFSVNKSVPATVLSQSKPKNKIESSILSTEHIPPSLNNESKALLDTEGYQTKLKSKIEIDGSVGKSIPSTECHKVKQNAEIESVGNKVLFSTEGRKVSLKHGIVDSIDKSSIVHYQPKLESAIEDSFVKPVFSVEHCIANPMSITEDPYAKYVPSTSPSRPKLKSEIVSLVSESVPYTEHYSPKVRSKIELPVSALSTESWQPKLKNGKETLPPVKAYMLPFVSQDPLENRDNSDPRWEIYRRQNTDRDRYEKIKDLWQNSSVPDPNFDMTSFNRFAFIKACNRAEGTHGSRNRRLRVVQECVLQSRRKKRSREEDTAEDLPAHKKQCCVGRLTDITCSLKHTRMCGEVARQDYEQLLRARYIGSSRLSRITQDYNRKQEIISVALREADTLHRFYSCLDGQNRGLNTLGTQRELQDMERLYTAFRRYYQWAGNEFVSIHV